MANRTSNKLTHRLFPSPKTGKSTELRTMDGEVIQDFRRVQDAYHHVKAEGGRIQRIDIPFDATKHVQRQPKKFSVAKRFGFMNKLIEMTAKGVTKGAIICGPAGIGKTHSVIEVLEREGMKENHDWIIIKGSISPSALYTTMYYNQDKLIVFDDCDSALFNPDAANLLKAVLDTCDKRVVSWINSKTSNGEGPPSSFEFTGQILFISNLSEDKVDPAIVSRALCLDLRMTKNEIMDRIEQLAPVILESLEFMQVTEVTKWMRDNLDIIFDLNLRTLIKLGQLRKVQPDWEDAAIYFFTR